MSAPGSRISISARLSRIVGGVPPAPVAPTGPRFLVGTAVKTAAGARGHVVEVYQDERRVRLDRGSVRDQWFDADKLAAVHPRRRRSVR